jgi:iron complex outermembrane receptor protein
MKSLFFTLMALIPLHVLHGQTLSLGGKVIDKNSDYPLVGATVQATLLPSKAVYLASTSFTGNFDMKLPANQTLCLSISYVGFTTLYDTIPSASGSLFKVYALQPSSNLLQTVNISSSVQASKLSPVAYESMTAADIAKLNNGQDIPVLLNQATSLVYTTDAGAGVGYSSLRIRGSDQSRINVTLNGIPLNDPESQGVFWVNMPDFASSVSSLQIQRGVGTSTNGAGAFGANINMETFANNDKATFELNNSYGSFNTQKNTMAYSTGWIDDRFRLNGRMSRIVSDGYLDRANSDLSSYYVGMDYRSRNKRFTANAIHFSGREKTYQAWYGTPASRVNGTPQEMQEFASRNFLTDAQTQNLLNSGRNYNFYEYANETDNYKQDHFQLHTNYEVNKNLKLSVSGFYIHGAGYYEQFREAQRYTNYGFAPFVSGADTIQRTDLVRQRWLRNDFYGVVYGLYYTQEKYLLQVGGGSNTYLGDHFGDVVWAQVAGNIPQNGRYYESNSVKNDHNVFAKFTYLLNTKLSFYTDLQVRNVQYQSKGLDDNRSEIDFDRNFMFFNPKAGLNYALSNKERLYVSAAIANREPVRRDFVDAAPGESPTEEKMLDIEMGYAIKERNWTFDANLYFMDYTNQLVLTGEINDVGGFVRKNVGSSYRAGLELSGAYAISKSFKVGANLTLSRNRIAEFKEVVYDWFEVIDPVEIVYTNTPIAFSPEIISAAWAEYLVTKDFTLGLVAKYVGAQYLDNSGQEASKLPAYFVPDLRMAYTLPIKGANMQLNLLVNNLTNTMYSSNGYTYKYFQGDNRMYNEVMLYPQAGTNFLLGLNVRF